MMSGMGNKTDINKNSIAESTASRIPTTSTEIIF